MRLTAYTDYTLRVLMYLAVNPGRNATVQEIATTFGISESHLTKIVHRLGVFGDVSTSRGRNGGLRLGKAAEAINLGAVVRRTEPDLALVACFGDVGACPIEGACVLSHALQEALDAFLAVLDRYTLVDLVAPRQRLAALLGFNPQLQEA
jgi:Rrf2 family nitric oxide-sensitive transcriptional repressor